MEMISVPKYVLQSMLDSMEKSITVTEKAQNTMDAGDGYAYSSGYFQSVVTNQISTLKALIGEQLW